MLIKNYFNINNKFCRSVSLGCYFNKCYKHYRFINKLCMLTLFGIYIYMYIFILLYKNKLF